MRNIGSGTCELLVCCWSSGSWFPMDLELYLPNQLDAIRIGGFGLGFWFAQQGSMYVFVIIIFVYVFSYEPSGP